jgi:hypothetical protein
VKTLTRLRADGGYRPFADGSGPVDFWVDPVAGSDANLGTQAQPWQTVQKAMATVLAAGGVRVGLMPGTHVVSVGAFGCWALNREFTAPVVFVGLGAGPADTVVLGSAGSRVLLSNAFTGRAANVHFARLTFHDGTTLASAKTFEVANPARCAGLRFTECRFRSGSSAGVNGYLVHVQADAGGASGDVVGDFTFERCEFLDNAHPGYALTFRPDNPASGTPLLGLRMRGCRSQVASFALRMYVSDVRIEDCDFQSTTGHGLLLGVDNVATGNPAETARRIEVSHCRIHSQSGHALLIGGGTSHAVVSGCHVQGGNQGVVVKEATDIWVEACEVRMEAAAGITGLYAKAGRRVMFRGNRVRAAFGTAFRVGAGDTGNKCQAVRLEQTDLTVTGTATLMNWGAASTDDGGGGAEANRWHRAATASFGTVRGTTITSAASLATAWSGYDTGPNDRETQLEIA